MKRFAKLVGNRVVWVINANSQEWCELNLGGKWVETFEENLASLNNYYNEDKNIFISEKPYPSWIYDEDNNYWYPPIQEPNDGKLYKWNEEILNWEEVIIEEEFEEL